MSHLSTELDKQMKKQGKKVKNGGPTLRELNNFSGTCSKLKKVKVSNAQNLSI